MGWTVLTVKSPFTQMGCLGDQGTRAQLCSQTDRQHISAFSPYLFIRSNSYTRISPVRHVHRGESALSLCAVSFHLYQYMDVCHWCSIPLDTLPPNSKPSFLSLHMSSITHTYTHTHAHAHTHTHTVTLTHTYKHKHTHLALLKIENQNPENCRWTFYLEEQISWTNNN